ncbi:uncharacterized protein LOC130934020 [Arachis stenosperma]|uniref:uncharacterized protein LOC130934020 n=1 Tax=Arachis stenosperma TaxID=217475 RepID=UPI0025AD6B97|nr:uncharacterized protein LOC130934020 [Arachis stenosperma]
MQPFEIKSNFERMEATIAQLSSQISGVVSSLMDRQTQTGRRIDANQEEYRSNLKNQGAAIPKLEAQVEILSKQIPLSTHKFPSNTMANPIGQCKAITLRSWKVVEEEAPSKDNHEEVAPKHGNEDEGETPISPPPKPVLKPYVPKAPYPQRLRKDGKDGQFSKFLEFFKRLQINISFAEALEQMPLYAKFLKELITKKRNWEAKETIVLIEECSTIIQKKLPQKLKDTGSFQIPCIIGDITIEKALMKIEEAKPTRMTLHLADRTFKFPHGVVEDLLVKVGEFIFPADFVVLDMEEEANTSIILGRPFLATVGAIIDVHKGELVLRLHKEKMVFNVSKAMSYPKEPIGECMLVDTMEQIVQEVMEEDQCEENIELEQASDGKLPQATMRNSIMPTTTDNKDAESPKLDLKALPPNLNYAYLGANNTYPVIINSSPSKEQEEELIQVLRQHKDAIRWTLSYLKGISP